MFRSSQPQAVSNNRFPVLVLLAVFLLQPVATYLAAPWFDLNESGLVEATCTLNGSKFEQLDPESSLGKLLAEDDFCPALELVDLASSVLEMKLPEIASAHLYLIGLLDQTGQHQHHYLHYSAYSSRAPPFISC